MRQLQLTAIAAVLLLTAASAIADTPVFSTRAGAIRGYDPVAYFTEAKPIEGSIEFTHDWNGASWRFASAANRDLFRSDPERFAPQYGGHCAYAMRTGKLVSIDPEAWHIVAGKLYLNYSLRIQKRWLEDIPGYVSEADAEWAGKHAASL